MTTDPTRTNPFGELPRIDPVAATKIAAQATAAAVAAGGIRLAGLSADLGRQPGTAGDPGRQPAPPSDLGRQPGAAGDLGTQPGPPGTPPGPPSGPGTQPGTPGDPGRRPGTPGGDKTPIVVGRGKGGAQGETPSTGGGLAAATGSEGWNRLMLIFPALLAGTLLWWLVDSVSTRQTISDLNSKVQLALDGKRKAEADTVALRDELGQRGKAAEAEYAKLAGGLAAAEAKIGPLEREKGELQKRLAELETGGKGSSDALAVAIARAEKAEAEVAVLRKALDVAGKDTGSASGADLAKLTTELDKARADLQSANTDMVGLKATIATATAEAKRLTDALAAKDADLRNTVAERQKLEKETGDLRSEVATATASLRQLKELYEKTEGNRNDAKADLAAINLCRAGAAEATKATPIRFESARAVLTGDSTATIAKVASALRLCPGVSVRIEGHTDADNRSGRNEQLSLERANVVRKSLVAAGIDGKLLSTAGCGHTYPLFPTEETTAQKEANRRIEFVIEEQRQPCRPR